MPKSETVDNSAKAQALASTPEWKLEQRRADLARKQGSEPHYIGCKICRGTKGTYYKAYNRFDCANPKCKQNPKNSEANSEHQD